MLKAFELTNGALSVEPVLQAVKPFAYPGAVPSISANGSSKGIVWVVERTSERLILHAYDANNLEPELYSSEGLSVGSIGWSCQVQCADHRERKSLSSAHNPLSLSLDCSPFHVQEFQSALTERPRIGLGQHDLALSADGEFDGVFTVTLLPGSGAQTVTELRLLRTGNEAWGHIPGGSWALGAAPTSEASLYNAGDATVNFPVVEGWQFQDLCLGFSGSAVWDRVQLYLDRLVF